MGRRGAWEGAACSGQESSEALALNVRSHLESIPDKEERSGPDLPSRGLVILFEADLRFWGGAARQSEQTSRVWSMSETMHVVVGAELGEAEGQENRDALMTCDAAVSGVSRILDRKSTRLNSSHTLASRMPSSA